MARTIEQLTDHEKNLIISAIFHQMYSEEVNREGSTITFQLDPDKEVNGGDLVDLVSHLFRQHRLVPDTCDLVEMDFNDTHPF